VCLAPVQSLLIRAGGRGRDAGVDFVNFASADAPVAACSILQPHDNRAAMTDYRSELLRLLSSRGYIHQVTDPAGLDALAASQVVPGYIGFDATAPSLHVGSLVQIMMLRRLQQTGHKPIVVMGGGTTKIGDPSGKDESRRLLDDATIKANIASIRRIFEQFLTFGDGPTDAVMVDNDEWLGGLRYIPLLRDIGTHFTINRMLTFDSVRLRLDREQPLTFLEFNYMILQAYDFLELSRRLGCRLQLGGSDQWGNIVNGIELARRIDGTSLFGVTTPLITTADGGKMGKTAAGAVWLNADQLKPYDYWQFWRNTQDADVGRFLRLFTDLPLEEIGRLEALQGSEINHAKKVLADETTTLAHGADEARRASDTARDTFEQGTIGAALPTLSIPAEGISIVQANTQLGFAASNKEARRKLDEGAIRVNDEKVSDPAHVVRPGDKISFGAKKHGLMVGID
jgi:tyrosyl-tRNA synthetase